jgi:hypothetical protein
MEILGAGDMGAVLSEQCLPFLAYAGESRGQRPRPVLARIDRICPGDPPCVVTAPCR